MRRSLVLLALLASLAHGQKSTPKDAPPDPIERYLVNLGLRDLVAVHLQDRLERAPAAQRLALGERLGAIYVQLLDEATSTQESQRVEALARLLLNNVPDAQSYQLRIDLAKVSYLRSEQIAERARLHMADDEAKQEAIRVLRSVHTTFNEVGLRVARRVDQLEKLERRGRADDEKLVRTQLAENRRLRSLAMYYAGWSSYYLALLTDSPPIARSALQDFGWLLNAPGGKVPTLGNLPRSLLRYEHVARAAMGVAMCHLLRGDDDEAVRWIDAVREVEDLPQSIRDQMFARRLLVYGKARRWADIEWILHQRGQTPRDSDAPILNITEARLLAIVTLDVLRDNPPNSERDALVEALAQVALGELVKAGEVGHVLDLVQVYGTTPIGDDGFIVRYVRGLREYEDARVHHADADDDDQLPTTSPTVTVEYLRAAEFLRAALVSDDADNFGDQRTRCRITLGQALYYAGSFDEAADRFEQAAASNASQEIRQEALWRAIMAVEQSIELGRTSLADRRDRLATLYLKSFPSSDRAARLLLRRARSDLIDPMESIAILLAIKPAAPLYAAARRHASSLLYRVYRRSPTGERDFAALRFLEVVGEVVKSERTTLTTGTNKQLQSAAHTLVLRLRQVLDAALGMSAPDWGRAERALDMIDEVARIGDMELGDLAGELRYRRLQLALARNNEEQITRALDNLRAIGGPYAQSADRLLYRRALQAWQADPERIALARQVLTHGERVAEQLTAGRPESLKKPSVQSLFDRVARAGEQVWLAEQDEIARAVARRFDRRLIQSGLKAETVLRRYASLSEAADDFAEALDTWRTLMAAATTDTLVWYEARYHSLDLLIRTDPERARAVMTQFKVLHPHWGPPPWNDRLAALDEALLRIPTPPGGSP